MSTKSEDYINSCLTRIVSECPISSRCFLKVNSARGLTDNVLCWTLPWLTCTDYRQHCQLSINSWA